ncbi:RGS-containing protein kinase RCK1 [Cavenderia fasciculata]|uniref:RGS-containing protein kinase RCK1 n=1 Tax=Cavenderia fasciculata TaxID=261658 RepID=F4Q7L0_CACFS|nr:RGS-containing protein kinase RCK1 [Cavenderia fasciculata]EGG16392.1 RGS-containing protein kinase RCK1 [Cavenderia fasciculata]|eukprot:XP_004354776.1 RGS-containing protein kinase RCK1 [Cavenderia fasciculata]
MEPIPLETVIVDQEIVKELQCGICLQIINKPRQCLQGHLYCLDCISQYLKKSQECPTCRTSLNVEKLSRSLFVERHLRNLNVWCKYHFENKGGGNNNVWEVDEQGCNEILTMENSTRHENTCEYSFEPCKLSSDCGLIRKIQLVDHLEKCPKRPIKCDHCLIEYPFSDIDKHLLECEMIEIQCDKCNTKLLKRDFETHKLNECPNCHVHCPFFDSGCLKMFDRKNLQEHIDKSLGEHLILMKNNYTQSISSLKKDFNQQLKEKDDQIKKLEKVLNDKHEPDTKIEWCVKNYSIAKKKGYIQSEKFVLGGFQWFLGFYTDGDSADSKGYISIYLFLDTHQIPKGKSLALEYYLKFFNHRDPSQSVKKEFRTTFPIKGGRGWGDRKAVKSALLDSSGFIKDDTLLVKAEINVKKTCWSIDQEPDT